MHVSNTGITLPTHTTGTAELAGFMEFDGDKARAWGGGGSRMSSPCGPVEGCWSTWMKTPCRDRITNVVQHSVLDVPHPRNVECCDP